MKPIKTDRAWGAIAIAIGIALALLLAYANAPGPIAGNTYSAGAAPSALTPEADSLRDAQIAAFRRQGLSEEQAAEALEVQSEAGRTQLVQRLEAAMGSAFGGVWYEPDAARYGVGVTSAASRRAAAEVAAGLGLAEEIAVTPVRSTAAELESEQRQLNGSLTGLFARGLVATAPVFEDNAVELKLSSSVSSRDRRELERQAAVASVDVSVVSMPIADLGITHEVSRCNEWAAKKAYCDKTIAGGVTIETEVGGKLGTRCSAGPAALLQDLTKETTETYVLTAGHCIEGEGTKEKWYAYNKAGQKHEIGEATEYLEASKKDKADVGIIKVNNAGHWVNKTLTPVNPEIPLWGDKAKPDAEPKLFPVLAQRNPVAKEVTCISASTTASHCGTVKQVKLAVTGVERLAQVEKTQTDVGDSGAPWYSGEKATEQQVEGTHVGKHNDIPIFHELEFSFAQLKTKLELLRKANETRPACPMAKGCGFESEEYPVTFDGEDNAGEEEFKAGKAASVICNSSFHGENTTEKHEANPSTVEVQPTYTECKEKTFGLAATVTTEGCKYVVHLAEMVAADEFNATTDVSCAAGKAIKLSVPGVGCELEIGSQSNLKSLKVVNDTEGSPAADITIAPAFSGITYTVTKDGAFCPLEGLGVKTNGEYTNSGKVTITGQDPSEPSTKYDIWASE